MKIVDNVLFMALISTSFIQVFIGSDAKLRIIAHLISHADEKRHAFFFKYLPIISVYRWH